MVSKFAYYKKPVKGRNPVFGRVAGRTNALLPAALMWVAC